MYGPVAGTGLTSAGGAGGPAGRVEAKARGSLWRDSGSSRVRWKLTTASLPGSVTIPRERSQVRGVLVQRAAPTMSSKKRTPGEDHFLNGGSFHSRSNEGRTSRERTSPPVE